MSGKRIKAYSRFFSSVLAYYQQVGVSGHVLFILVSFVIPYHIPWAIGCFEHDLCLLCENRILVKPEAQSQHSSITTLFPFLSQTSLHDQKHPRCVPVLSSPHPLPVLPPWPITVCSISGLFSALRMQGQPGSLGSAEVEGPRWPSGTLDIHLPPAGSVT